MHDHEVTFNVADNYYFTRAVLTWSDIGLVPDSEEKIPDELINRLDLRIYPNSTCSGNPIAQSLAQDDNLLVIEVPSGYPVPVGGGIWCARMTGNVITAPLQAGLAFFSAAREPTLYVTSSPDRSEPLDPNAPFAITTRLLNLGIPAAGAYISIDLPVGFLVSSVSVETNTGIIQTYSAEDIRRTGDAFTGLSYSVAVGQLTSVRTAHWAIQPTGAVGSFAFHTTGRAVLANQEISPDNDSSLTLCFGENGDLSACIYVPFVLDE